MSRKLFAFLSLVVLTSMVITSCAPQTVEKVVEVTKIVAGTSVVQQIVVTPTPVPPTAAPATAVPKASDTVVLALQQDADTLHPMLGSMMARTIIRSAFWPGCIGQNEKAEWIAHGCERVPTLENGDAKFVGDGADKHMEITYKIKKGWRWTDGKPVTSKDAIYTWKLSMDPEMELASRDAPEKIYEVVAVDDSVFTVKFLSEKQAKAAAAGTLKGDVPFEKFKDDYLAAGYGTISGPVVDPTYWNVIWTASVWLPSHILEKIPAKDQASSEFARKPLGDGAYVLKEWKAGQEVVLEKSDKPFLLGDAKIKTIVFRIFADSKAVIAALQKGEIDAVTGVGGLTTADVPDLDKIEAAGKYKVLYEPGYQWEHIDINTQKFPLDDVKVRQALYHAIDRQKLVDTLYFGRQRTTDLPVPPGLSWSYTDSYTKYPYDLNKAKALLKEAGWDCKTQPCTKKVTEGGKEVTKQFEITLMTTDRTDRQALAQVVQSQWKALNIGVNIQFLYGRGLFATCSAGGPLYCRTFDAAIYTWNTGDDPQFAGLYDCAGISTKENNWTGQNSPGWCNKAADEMIFKNEKDLETSLSREKRKPVLEKFYQEWTKDVPVIPMFSNTRVYVHRVGFKNWKAGPTQNAPDAWNAWEWELSK